MNPIYLPRKNPVYHEKVYKEFENGRHQLEQCIREKKMRSACGFSWLYTAEGSHYWGRCARDRIPASDWLPKAKAILAQGIIRYGEW